MGDGAVEARRLLLLRGHILAAPDTAGVRLAEGQMAGGVFVEQGLVEQDPGIADGGIVGHQGHLTQVVGALVGVDGPAQVFLPHPGVYVHDAAALEVQVEVLHQIAVHGQGQGGVCPAVHPIPAGGGEDLLGGDVGHEFHAPRRGVAAPGPHMVLRQADGQVGAQGIGVAQGLELVLVERLGPAGGGGDVLLPALHGLSVPGDAAHGEDGVPQRVHGVLALFVRERLFRPGPGGIGAHAPLEPVGGQRVEVGLRGGAGRLAAGLDAGGVHAAQQLRVGAHDGQPGAFLLQHPVEPGLLVAGILLEHGGVRPEETLPGVEVVAVVDHHVPGPAVVAGGHAQPGQGGVFDAALDTGGLPRLDVQPHLHQQAGVFVQLCFKILDHLLRLLFCSGRDAPPFPHRSGRRALAVLRSCAGQFAGKFRLVHGQIWKLYHIGSENTIPFAFFSAGRYNSLSLMK